MMIEGWGFLAFVFVVGLTTLFFLLPSKSPNPKQFSGHVEFVIDGDTLKIEGLKPHIRLWGVDAPEKGEAGAQKARAALKRMAEGKTISLTQIDQDHYGRIVARVFLPDGREINQMLITQGFSREYCHYSKGFYGQCGQNRFYRQILILFPITKPCQLVRTGRVGVYHRSRSSASLPVPWEEDSRKEGRGPELSWPEYENSEEKYPDQGRIMKGWNLTRLEFPKNIEGEFFLSHSRIIISMFKKQSRAKSAIETFTLLGDLPRGVRSKSTETHKGPRAAWRETAQIRTDENLQYNNRKILLGSIDGDLIGMEDDRHLVTIAGSRAGKGVSCIIPNLLHYTGSVLVIDPKGELASITAQRRKDLGQQVYILDPFEKTAPWLKNDLSSFNPLTALKNRKFIIENANLIADALIVRNSQADPHWDESAREVLESLILHVATFPKYEGKRNLMTVRHLLLAGTDVTTETEEGAETLKGLKGLLFEMRTNLALDGFVQALATSLHDKPEKRAWLDHFLSTTPYKVSGPAPYEECLAE